MLWQQMQQQTVDLGWEFYGPVMMMVALIALAVPVWAALGIGSVVMLVGRVVVRRHRPFRFDRGAVVHLDR